MRQYWFKIVAKIFITCHNRKIFCDFNLTLIGHTTKWFKYKQFLFGNVYVYLLAKYVFFRLNKQIFWTFFNNTVLYESRCVGDSQTNTLPSQEYSGTLVQSYYRELNTGNTEIQKKCSLAPWQYLQTVYLHIIDVILFRNLFLRYVLNEFLMDSKRLFILW